MTQDNTPEIMTAHPQQLSEGHVNRMRLLRNALPESRATDAKALERFELSTDHTSQEPYLRLIGWAALSRQRTAGYVRVDDVSFGRSGDYEPRTAYDDLPQFTRRDVVTFFLEGCENEAELQDLITTSLDVSVNAPPARRINLNKDIFISFMTHGEAAVDSLLDYTRELIASNDEDEQAKGLLFKHHVNTVIKQWAKGKSDITTDQFKSALEGLERYDLLEPSKLNNFETLMNPAVAEVLARSKEDIFSNVDPKVRKNMVGPFMLTVLDKLTSDDERHQPNTQRIREMLFSGKSRDQRISFLDIIKLANSITSGLNQRRPQDKQQDLLACDEPTVDVLVNCGEAVFRILEVTSGKQDHVAENRSFAELVDAMLRPAYSSTSTRPVVTVADICARYPDAKRDVVTDLKEIAAGQGYSAASRQYAGLRRHHGSHVFFNRNRPGYGAQS